MLLTTSVDPVLQEFDRIAQRLIGWGEMSTRGVMPLDGVRRKDDVLLRFDLPGIDPESIEVTVDRGVLTVSARRSETYGDDDQVFVRERPMGAFTRRVYLTDNLDTDKVEATYTNGVLTVRIPVAESARPRKIEVRTGDQKALSA